MHTCKKNIKYMVATNVIVGKNACWSAYEHPEEVGHTIIYFQKLNDCCKLYRFSRQKLGRNFTNPYGSLDLCCNRVLDMFHSCTETCRKDGINKSFSTSSTLRVIIAFGKGVNIHDIWNIIHIVIITQNAEEKYRLWVLINKHTRQVETFCSLLKRWNP